MRFTHTNYRLTQNPIVMKKLSMICALAFCSVLACGQDGGLTSKKGMPIQPEADEYGLGFNAVPVLNYLGNALNGNAGNSINNSSYFVNSDNMLYGKKMVDANTAYRMRLRVRNNNTTWKNNVVMNGAISADSTVEDKWNRNDQLIGVGFGMEKRRGKGRVVGVYGVEAAYMTASLHDKYTFGNQMGGQFVAPMTTSDFFSGTSAVSSSRATDVKWGRSHSIGANLFAGVEYFIASKVALGGEFTWGAAYTVTTKNSTEREVYTNDVETQTTTNAGSSGVTLDTGNYGGAISVLFYF